jgi:hypothetical protein
MLNLNKNLKIIILLIKYILNYILYKKNNKSYYLLLWGLGIGDWGLGIGDWAQSPIPNPPIPNPQSPMNPKNKNNILLCVYK